MEAPSTCELASLSPPCIVHPTILTARMTLAALTSVSNSVSNSVSSFSTAGTAPTNPATCEPPASSAGLSVAQFGVPSGLHQCSQMPADHDRGPCACSCKQPGHTTATCPHRIAPEHGCVQAASSSQHNMLGSLARRERDGRWVVTWQFSLGHTCAILGDKRNIGAGSGSLMPAVLYFGSHIDAFLTYKVFCGRSGCWRIASGHDRTTGMLVVHLNPLGNGHGSEE